MMDAPIYGLVEPVTGLAPIAVEANTASAPVESNNVPGWGASFWPPDIERRNARVIASNGCTIRRLADKPYLQLQLDFPAAGGELLVYCGGQLIDRADLVKGWQHSAVELKGVPSPAELTLTFSDAAGAVVEKVPVQAIFLSDSWGRGQRKRLKCSMPFDLVNVLQNGDVSMCMCHEWLKAGSVLGNNKQDRIKDVWNGPGYQRMRRLFLEGRHEEVCRKEVCLVLKGDIRICEPTPQVIASVNEGRTVLDHGPAYLQHDVDRGCNLECVMCRDNRILPNEENVERGLRDVQDALDLGAVRRVSWSGAGEIFAMKKIVQLMETDTFSREDIAFTFTTNLTYFNEKLWQRIGHNKITVISVSADGCSPEIYNNIRVGGDWDELLENMRFLSTLRREGKVKVIGWNYTILRQNIRDVGKAIHLAEELGFDHLRFIAQFGELRRTVGNMFEECDMEALDALYDELDRAKAFDKPWIWMSETGMRERRYRTPEFRLDFAQYIYRREGDPTAKSKNLAAYNRRRSLKIIRGLMDDMETGKISPPENLPEQNIQFLSEILGASPSTFDMLKSLWSMRQTGTMTDAADARRMTKWAHKLVASLPIAKPSRRHGPETDPHV